MPLEIVRNDITNMQVDAIVNAASHRPLFGSGVDAGIHQKAGPKLLKARKAFGFVRSGNAFITPAFDLNAKYVIHAVGPIWRGGSHQEEQLLRRCYEQSLALALENGCTSVAFPLLAAGNHGFPKELALQIAISAFSSFLMDHEMMIYLVVFNRDVYVLSEKLFRNVASYIDENYIREKTREEYLSFETCKSVAPVLEEQQRAVYHRRLREFQDEICLDSVALPGASAPMAAADTSLEDFLKQKDAGFAETLVGLIERSGRKNSEVYKKANVDKKLFSKIINNVNYHPSKETAVAFAIALELDLDGAKDLIARAGYALTHSSKFDIIVEYFILHGNYNVFEINETLFAFDQRLLGY
ncbi:MAG: macro domain-containing protein [Oscillospiraceae bacterium]|nr:macro domain-containing protein [Oscillospiraceae bacterium]